MSRHDDPWRLLRAKTSARIALGRSGGSLPTRELLDFGLAHGRARDAVHAEFDAAGLAVRLSALGASVVVSTRATSRRTYLARPDLGRRLDHESAARLRSLAPSEGFDLAMVVSDGLSAHAASRHAPSVLDALLPRLLEEGWRVAPLVVAANARVAAADEIGERLRATIAVILLGERPGLSSPDSLGAYLVHEPRVGRSDAERNCVSNIRPEGLPPAAAAETLHWLLTESRRRKLSGVALKDERGLLSSNPADPPLPAE